MTTASIKEFAAALLDNLNGNIMPYWIDRMTDSDGGYYGRRDGEDRLDATAERGAILNARILWSLAAAARATGRADYASAAARQYDYLRNHFIDPEYGGVYWSIRADGTPADTRKQFYAIAFTIYGLAEYARLTGDQGAIGLAVDLFRCIETHSRDRSRGGYLEAMTRDWQPIADMRLSDKDLNASKTMNTHLHILEAYACLLRVWPTDECREATSSLLKLFNDVIAGRDGHLGLFFDDDMQRIDGDVSYGHDIEASWLMLEAARVIDDPELENRTLDVTRRVAHAALEGIQSDGSMIYERHASGETDRERHWWVQAETVVGQLYLAAFHGEHVMIEGAMATWRYIDANLVDHDGGEWYWSRMPDGIVNRRDDKAGFWKCPYHNSRMCIEGAAQLAKLAENIK